MQIVTKEFTTFTAVTLRITLKNRQEVSSDRESRAQWQERCDMVCEKHCCDMKRLNVCGIVNWPSSHAHTVWYFESGSVIDNSTFALQV